MISVSASIFSMAFKMFMIITLFAFAPVVYTQLGLTVFLVYILLWYSFSMASGWLFSVFTSLFFVSLWYEGHLAELYGYDIPLLVLLAVGFYPILMIWVQS